MKTTRDKYMKNELIVIPCLHDSERTFAIGLTKARAILAVIDEIEQFVSENDGVVPNERIWPGKVN